MHWWKRRLLKGLTSMCKSTWIMLTIMPDVRIVAIIKRCKTIFCFIMSPTVAYYCVNINFLFLSLTLRPSFAREHENSNWIIEKNTQTVLYRITNFTTWALSHSDCQSQNEKMCFYLSNFFTKRFLLFPPLSPRTKLSLMCVFVQPISLLFSPRSLSPLSTLRELKK
jgi:hypothetical protein